MPAEGFGLIAMPSSLHLGTLDGVLGQDQAFELGELPQEKVGAVGLRTLLRIS